MAETIAKEKDKLVQEFNQVVANAEELLDNAARAGGEKAQAMQDELKRALDAWRTRLAELEDEAMRRARAAAQDADAYVRANPWQAVGIAAAVGALVGVAAGLLTRRSR